jgi:hypothetical protein
MGWRACLFVAVVLAVAAAVAQPTGAEARAPDLIKSVEVPLNQNVDDLVAGRYVVKVMCARACLVGQVLVTSRTDAKALGLPVAGLEGLPPRLLKNVVATGTRIGVGTTHLAANTPTVLHYKLDARAKRAIAAAKAPIHIAGAIKVTDQYGSLFTYWYRTCKLPG